MKKTKIKIRKIKKIKKTKPKELTGLDLSNFRKKIHIKQRGICPILKKEFPVESMVVDHLHKKHAKLLKLPNSGQIRGVIHRQANSFEGKIANVLIRLGLHKFNISLPDLLRNTANYLEREPYPYLHPSEKPKAKELSKNSFNLLKKLVLLNYPNRKPLEYPKSGKLTKKLKEYYEEFGVEPKFNKRSIKKRTKRKKKTIEEIH
jgi:hypothetical protein